MVNPYNYGSVPVLLEALPRLVAPEGRLDLGGGLLNHRVAQVDVCNERKSFEIEKEIFVCNFFSLDSYINREVDND